MHDLLFQSVTSLLLFVSVFVLIAYGWPTIAAALRDRELWYDKVLNHQLLLDVPPRLALALSIVAIFFAGALAAYLAGGPLWFILGAIIGYFVPQVIVKHLEQKRKERLEEQLVDGITTLSSGVRAGLNLVQAMELLARNSSGPIKQEIAQLLREYQMGLDLNQAMRNTANRIGSAHYRLLFTAIEMHRLRGGDTGESLDRIAESIREHQRLEGKLDALTAQGRSQARMMAVMPLVFLGLLEFVDPIGVNLLFTEPIGRVLLLLIFVLIAAGYMWIRKIMAVDI